MITLKSNTSRSGLAYTKWKYHCSSYLHNGFEWVAFLVRFCSLSAFLFLCNGSLKAQHDKVQTNDIRRQWVSKLTALRRNSSDSALPYANDLIEKAKTDHDSWLESEATLELARIFFAKDDPVKSLQLAIYSESISSPYNGSYFSAPEFIAFILNRQGKADAALQYLFKSLHRADSAAMIRQIISNNLTIADVYRENGNCDKALNYGLKALQLMGNLNDSSLLIYTYSTISNIYSNSDYRNEKRLDTALYYYSKIMEPVFVKRWFKPYDSARHFLNMGRLYGLVSRLDDASKLLDLALEVSKRKQFKSLEQNILNEQLTLEMKKGNREKALLISAQAQKTLPESQTNIKRYKELTDRSRELLGGTGDYQLAYENLLKSDSIRDSIFNIRKIKAVAEIDKKYIHDTELLKAENKARKKENERNSIIFVAILSIIILTSLFSWKIYERRKQNEFLGTLIHEVNHRTKNNLQMLNALIAGIYQNVHDKDSKSEILKLKSYIQSFGLMYDYLTRVASFDEVNIAEYTQNIGKALMAGVHPQDLTFLCRADHNIIIHTEKAILIGLIINELMTNSIKYAFPEPGPDHQISIHIAKEKDNLLNIEYADNGIGFSPDVVHKKTYGLQMIHAMTKQLKGTIQFDTDLITKVRITVPLI